MTPPRWQRHRARSIPGETWLNLKAELLAFPTGKHDDQVALGQVGSGRSAKPRTWFLPPAAWLRRTVSAWRFAAEPQGPL